MRYQCVEIFFVRFFLEVKNTTKEKGNTSLVFVPYRNSKWSMKVSKQAIKMATNFIEGSKDEMFFLILKNMFDDFDSKILFL